MRGTWQTTDTGGHGGLVLVVVVVALAIGSGAASAAVSALVTILIVLGSIIGFAVLCGIGVLVYRGRQDRPAAPIGARPVHQVPSAAPQRLEAAQPLAIEAPRNELHLHFHGMDAAEVAEAIREASKGR